MIDITGVDLVKFVKNVYDLSRPVGMGFLHFTPGPLSDDDAQRCIMPAGGSLVVSMDYVHGRGCKMSVWRKLNRLEIDDAWYDHTDAQLQELLAHVGVAAKTGTEHGKLEATK